MASTSAYFAPIQFRVIDATYRPSAIFTAFADLNGDGIQDLIELGASYPSPTVTSPVPQPGKVYFGSSDGVFTAAPESVFPNSSLQTVHPRKVITADFNGDGKLDIFVSSHGWDAPPFPGEQNRLYLSQFNGTWIDATSTLPQISDYSHSSSVGDLNGDGRPDIFVGNGYQSSSTLVQSYSLINDGTGHFIQSAANLPQGSGSILDNTTGHLFPGSSIADFDGDGKQDLLIDADATSSFSKNTNTTILWNNGGTFSEASKTLLPQTASFKFHIDLSAIAIDFNSDGFKDIVIVGTQGDPFYDGSFVQVLRNNGDRTFADISSSALTPSDQTNGVPGATTSTPWAQWVTALDFNHDGLLDFSVEYNGSPLKQSTPLVYLSDGFGHFTTLKVSDFVAPGFEWQLGNGHLTPTSKGYSFITTQMTDGGLAETGLLASKPYDGFQVSTAFAGTARNDVITGSSGSKSYDGLGGLDAINLAGSRASYSVSGTNASAEARDVSHTSMLSNIERLQFNDSVLALDIQGNAGNAYRLYQAAFNRTPDTGGLSYWTHGLDIGIDIQTIAQGFVASAEFKQVYGANPTNSHIIDLFYQNVLGRAGEPGGVAYWNNALNIGVPVSEVLQGFAVSAENHALVDPKLAQGIVLDHSAYLL